MNNAPIGTKKDSGEQLRLLSPNPKMEVIKLGSYAEITVGESYLVKKNIVEDPLHASTALEEAEKRVALTQYYYEQLVRVGVSLPETSIRLGLHFSGVPTVEVRAQKICTPNALIVLPAAPLQEQLAHVDMMLKEVVKIIHTQKSDYPIGYDTGFDNFIVEDNRAYLVDIYPPRIAHEVTQAGDCQPLRWEELLVGYPEGSPLEPEKIERLKTYYYTQNGTVCHFALWALAVTSCLRDVSGQEPLATTPRSEGVLNKIHETLRCEGLSALIHPLMEFLESDRGKLELRQLRLAVQERYAVAMRSWRTICHLF